MTAPSWRNTIASSFPEAGPLRKTIVFIAVMALWTPQAVAQNTFGGRVVAGVESTGIVVTIERQGGQILMQTFTDSRGAFRFQDVSAADRSNDNYVYLVVEEEGFKPYRERLDATQIRGGGVFTIYLEPEGAVPGAGDGTAVDVRQLLAEIPEDALEEYERALEDADDGDHEDAAERLERAIEIAPDYYDAWIDLGGQYNALDRFDDAKRAYEQAVAVNPNGALAYVNLGALYYQEGQRHAATENGIEALGTFAEARASLETAIELDPASVPGHFYLGATYYRMMQIDEAESELQLAIDIAGQHAQSRLMLINVYARQQRYDDALEQANAFLDENPDAPEREAIERVQSQLEDALGR